MSLEIMKTKAEILRVNSANAEMEVSIFERQLDIERIKKNMDIQENKLKELNEKLKKLQEVDNV